MYRINEIFYSLQGEGFWTGTPVVFVRFSGCNLQCPFCDTDHLPHRLLTAREILSEVRQASPDCRRICFTGGEPGLQLDEALIELCKQADYLLHVETNGTHPLPSGIDWVTLSPKEDVPGLQGIGTVMLERADEIKVVFDGSLSPERLSHWTHFPAPWHFLQPCDTGEEERNRHLLQQTLAYLQAHPSWRLSLQTHKLLNIK